MTQPNDKKGEALAADIERIAKPEPRSVYGTCAVSLSWPQWSEIIDALRGQRSAPSASVPPIHRAEWDGTIRFESDCVVNGYPVKAGTSWGPFEKSRNPNKEAHPSHEGTNNAGGKSGGNPDLEGFDGHSTPAPSSTGTPRTDAQHSYQLAGIPSGSRCVDIEFSRQLERELATETEGLRALSALYERALSATRLRGQTIEQWAERAEISERNLEEWIRAHSTPMPYGIGDSPEHAHTDKCSFDRNSSISEDRYVCECGWRAPADGGNQQP